jgi:CDGSH-type Zn-finger protein
VNTARIRENGPLALHADLKLPGSSAFRATLCRCGDSKNKPYCDGSHTAAAFTATGEPATQESPALATRGGPLTVAPATNGPLLISGPLEIVSGTGRTILKTEKSALCRCGHSSNKPFCDGTHRKIGFQAS